MSRTETEVNILTVAYGELREIVNCKILQKTNMKMTQHFFKVESKKRRDDTNKKSICCCRKN